MIASFLENSFITEKFQEFYFELLKQKQKALKLRIYKNQRTLTESALSEKITGSVQEIQHKLKAVLEKQSLQALKQVGEFAVSHFQEAQYVMAVLSDETFLTLNWPGKKLWENSLIEGHMFHTQIAGEMFFKKLDQLLSNHDPMKLDLAIIYLWALGLGFKGKYRDEDDEKIRWYKFQLYQLIQNAQPTLYHPGREDLLFSPYESNVSEPVTREMPAVRKWLMIFILSVLGYLLISHAVWYWSTKEVSVSVHHILSYGKEQHSR